MNFSKLEICQEALQLALTRLAGDCLAPNHAADAVAHWLQNPNGKSGSRTLSGVAAEALEFKASCTTPEDAQDVPQELEEQYEEQWLPGPPSGRGPTCGIFLDPEVKQGGAGREAENFEALSLSALQRRAEPDGELTSLAEREPQVQTLQRLQFILRKLQAKQMNRHHPPAANKKCCGTWRSISTEGLQFMKGSRVRIRKNPSELWREAELLDVLHAPREQRVQKLFLIQERENNQRTFQVYRDLSLWETELQNLPAGCHVESCLETEQLKWPECIAHGQTIRGVASAGVFVNLAALGISDGCFREDCTYTDHFSSGSPATCARMCASIRACRWWSFWTSRTGGTCWLRRHDQQRDTMMESMTASRECLPSFAPVAEAEPTLFQLAKDALLGPELRRWDLAKVLENFGHLTPSQIQIQGDSPVRRSALGVAKKLAETSSNDAGALADDGWAGQKVVVNASACPECEFSDSITCSHSKMM